MQINIEPEKRWDVSEGIWDATFDEIRDVTDKKSNRRKVRMVFRIDEHSSDYKILCVAKNFEPTLDPGSDLRKFLVSWLGEDYMEQHIEGGKFDFNSLDGKKARVEIIHIHNESHSKPYSALQSIHPPRSSNYEHSGDGI